MAAGVNTREMSKHNAVMRVEAGGQTCSPPDNGGLMGVGGEVIKGLYGSVKTGDMDGVVGWAGGWRAGFTLHPLTSCWEFGLMAACWINWVLMDDTTAHTSLYGVVGGVFAERPPSSKI